MRSNATDSDTEMSPERLENEKKKKKVAWARWAAIIMGSACSSFSVNYGWRPRPDLFIIYVEESVAEQFGA